MDAVTKMKLGSRLRRVEGQVAAVRRMIDEDAHCTDTLTQIRAAQGALGRVAEIVLSNHIEHCVTEAFDSGDADRRQRHIDELLDLFARYGSRP